MRFNQQISAYLRLSAACAVAVCVFASGRIVSASEQAPQTPAQTPAPQLPPPMSGASVDMKISSDEAVRLALENNLGIQASRLSPQVQDFALAQTRANYAPVLFSNTTKNSDSNPPSNFLSGSTANFLTSEGFRTNGGVQQLLKWGGGRYSLSLAAGRTTTSDPSDPFNPRLSSNMLFNYTQPLLRNFKIDNIRQQLLVGEIERQIVDVQLQERITQTARRVRNAYFDLIGAIGQLDVARQTLELSQQSLKDSQTRVEVGTAPAIDLVEAQAEVARNEEGVIVSEARIKTLEDALRALVLNPNQADFWTTRLTPSEQPVLTPQPIDVEGAVKNALANRTDINQARKQLEQTDVDLKYARNQRLPNIDAIVNYGVAGVGGTRFQFDDDAGVFPPPILNQSERSLLDAFRDVFGNEFKTWSVQVQFSYPIGTSIADAAVAQTRVQRQQELTNLRQLEILVTTGVRDAARQVETSLRRVDATKKAREFAERRLDAEQRRMSVGLSTTFQVFQAQRDISTARLSELNAIIDYNRALVNFQAVQSVPLQ
jgi:outer membrane protein TolC